MNEDITAGPDYGLDFDWRTHASKTISDPTWRLDPSVALRSLVSTWIDLDLQATLEIFSAEHRGVSPAESPRVLRATQVAYCLSEALRVAWLAEWKSQFGDAVVEHARVKCEELDEEPWETSRWPDYHRTWDSFHQSRADMEAWVEPRRYRPAMTLETWRAGARCPEGEGWIHTPPLVGH